MQNLKKFRPRAGCSMNFQQHSASGPAAVIGVKGLVVFSHAQTLQPKNPARQAVQKTETRGGGPPRAHGQVPAPFGPFGHSLKAVDSAHGACGLVHRLPTRLNECRKTEHEPPGERASAAI